MTLIEYAVKFIQLSRFAVYLISDEGKKPKKFEMGLSPHIRTMIACFDIRNFSQLVDHTWMYEENLRENASVLTEQGKRTIVLGTSNGMARPGKRMAMSGQPSQWPPQGHAPIIPQYQPQQYQKNQAP
jgi:hypothetical protein